LVEFGQVNPNQNAAEFGRVDPDQIWRSWSRLNLNQIRTSQLSPKFDRVGSRWNSVKSTHVERSTS